MANITTSNARRNLAGLINDVASNGEHVVLERRGEKIAAIIPVEELRLLELILQRTEDRRDKAEIRRAKREIARHGTISWDELKNKLNL